MAKRRTLLEDEHLSQKITTGQKDSEGETTVLTNRTNQKLKTIYKLDERDLSCYLIPVAHSTNKNRFAYEARRRSVVSTS